MYYHHNLRTDLQDWQDRLYRGSNRTFRKQLKSFFSFLETTKVTKGLIDVLCSKHLLTDEQLRNFEKKIDGGMRIEHDTPDDHAAFSFQFLEYLINRNTFNKTGYCLTFRAQDFEGTKTQLIEEHISPIINCLLDKLDNSSSVLYLLEKYKKRSEWFKKTDLNNNYKTTNTNYEQIFEDDLRLYLFDQGVDYPSLIPKSASGRADNVGKLDRLDPIVVEIIIFDRSKGYGKKRIRDGFTQIVKYTSDYNRDFGYLVIFNMDRVKINFKFQEANNLFRPMLSFNNKTYFFIIVNLFESVSASKLRQIKTIEITDDDLIQENFRQLGQKVSCSS